MRYEYVFWDWNGTLVNDVYAALASVNDILLRRGREPIDIERYYSLVATPITLFYIELFKPDKADLDALFPEFHAGYDRYLPRYGLADGAVELLYRLKRAGVSQAIISSSEENRLVEQTRTFGIDGVFDRIIGQSGFHAGSKLERARGYMLERGIPPERTLMIGDLDHDAAVAEGLGVDCLLYSGGHQSRAILEKLGPPVIDRLDEALRFIFPEGTPEP